MPKSPLDISLTELDEAARLASERADAKARAAGLKVAGVVSIDHPATVLTLGAHRCKWPIGDPALESYRFCGRRSAGDGPYCAEHTQQAYAPAKSVEGQRKPDRSAGSSRRRA